MHTGLIMEPAVARPHYRPTECRHCGDSIPRVRRERTESDACEFCCDGCEVVYGLLSERGMEKEYYALRKGKRAPLKPEIVSGTAFASLDEPPFRNSAETAELDFFLEGIHCTACLWLLERLTEFDSGVEWSRLDLGRALLRVRVGPSGKFAKVSELLCRLGYRPHPVLSSQEAENRLKMSDRSTLRRIGVSAFSAMNVMIYSVSLYGGVGGNEGTLFRVLSVITALPALTYGAWPFYRSAWAALRAKRISIDLPIAIAFIGGFCESLRQTILGSNLLYLDSITSLVFLMLVSRYVLSRLERAELSKSGLLRAFVPSKARKVAKDGVSESIPSDHLEPGDLFEILSGDRIPADGVVVSGGGYVDLSFLTGEAKPVRLTRGSRVYAGSGFLDGVARVSVAATAERTRLGQLQERLERLVVRRNSITERSDRWATLFLGAVLGFSVVLFLLFGRDDPSEAIRRSLSLFIIACPCALALATPLTVAQAHRLAVSFGIFLRDPDVLERVVQVSRIFFDKTGTLTTGEPKVSGWEWTDASRVFPENHLLSVLYTLEENSRHPYGKAIAKELEDRPGVKDLGLPVFEEPEGTGIGLRSGDEVFRVGRPQGRNEDDSFVEFSRNGVVLARIHVEDRTRTETAAVVRYFQSRGLPLKILSGDGEDAVARCARDAGVREWEARLNPEQKKEEVDRFERNGIRTLVVGDGVNDSLAMKSSFVGVAIARGNGATLESALTTASAAFLRSDLGLMIDLFDVAARYRRTLIRNMVFSVTYNLIGASLAVAGVVHPLVAAIIMPTSALTVYFSTVIGLRAGPKRGEA